MTFTKNFGPDISETQDFATKQKTIAKRIASQAETEASKIVAPSFSSDISDIINDGMYPDLMIINEILEREILASNLKIEVSKRNGKYYMTVENL